MQDYGLIFSGEYTHQLDEKVRFKLPKKLHDTILREYGIECVLMRMPEKCLAIYPAKIWKKEFQKILSSSGPAMPGSADYRALTRIIGANSLEINIGAQGRVALPEGYRKYIEVEGGQNIVVAGAGARIEIWSEESWNANIGTQMESYSEIIERTSEQMMRSVAENGSEGHEK